jgi:hypothetical protein
MRIAISRFLTPGASQHQVGKIRARNQQHQSRNHQQNIKRGVVLISQMTHPRTCGISGEAKVLKGLQLFAAVTSRGGLCEEPGAERIKILRGAL